MKNNETVYYICQLDELKRMRLSNGMRETVQRMCGTIQWVGRTVQEGFRGWVWGRKGDLNGGSRGIVSLTSEPTAYLSLFGEFNANHLIRGSLLNNLLCLAVWQEASEVCLQPWEHLIIPQNMEEEYEHTLWSVGENKCWARSVGLAGSLTWRELKTVKSHANTVVLRSMANTPTSHVSPRSGRRMMIPLSPALWVRHGV